MNKIYILLTVYASTLLMFGQSYSRLTDSVFNYLEGDWYQSYRQHNGSVCTNGIKKFPVSPIKITYKKTSDTTGLIIKYTGEGFYSHYLNEGFGAQKIKDTLYMAWDNSINEYIATNSPGFGPSIQINSEHEHLMVFYENSWVAFERDPYRAQAVYLVKNNWVGSYCAISGGQKQCLATQILADFDMKNDTLVYRGSTNKKFMYNPATKSYQEIGADSVMLYLDHKDSSVTITDGSLFEVKLNKGKAYRVKSQDEYEKYIGNWLDLKSGGIVDIAANDDTLIAKKDRRVLFAAILMHDGGGRDYLSVINQDEGCVPEYSRYEYVVGINGQTTLRNFTTGDEFRSVITDLNQVEAFDAHGFVFANPVSNGMLTLENLNEFEFEIFSAQGVTLLRGKAENGKVYLGNLKDGCHLMRIHHDGNTEVIKFLKE